MFKTTFAAQLHINRSNKKVENRLAINMAAQIDVFLTRQENLKIKMPTFYCKF